MSDDPGLQTNQLLAIVARVRPPVLPAVVIAHRGDAQNAPENTLASFQRALTCSHMIEFDIRMCATGELMVFHDKLLHRTTDGDGEVLKHSLAQLKELTAGAWFSPSFKSERIPTLDEVLDLMRGQAVPLIEIKDKHRKLPQVAKELGAALTRHGMADKAVVVVKELNRLKAFKAASPATPIVYLTFTKRQARAARRLKGIGGIDPYWKSMSLKMIQQTREAGLFITPWTVNRKRDMERLLELGIVAMVTDCPVTLADQIEGFEFERTEELVERFLRGEAPDVDLESDEVEGEDPEAVSRRMGSDSETDIQVEWPDDPEGE